MFDDASTPPEKQDEPESQCDENVVPIGNKISDDDLPPLPEDEQIEHRTLREIFDQDKSGALESLRVLSEIIQDIELDPYFDEEAASDENRPMRALLLAQFLTRQLQRIECCKIIIANEDQKRTAVTAVAVAPF